MICKNVHFNVLVERLEKDYGADHPVVSFRDSQFRVFNSTVDRFTVGDLYKPEVQKKVTGLTTFYLPPKDLRKNDLEMAKRLGLRIPPEAKPLSGPYQTDVPYSARDRAAVRELDTHQLPENYKRLRASSLGIAMKELAIDPRARELFNKSPTVFAATHPNLRPPERAAIESRKMWMIHTAMKASPGAVADEFVQACLSDSNISRQLTALLKHCRNDEGGIDEINTWLKTQGYDTTLEEVDRARPRGIEQSLKVYSHTYNTLVDDNKGPQLIIGTRSITFDSALIKRFKFTDGVLSWSQADGNASTVKVAFDILTHDNDKPLPSGSYVGPLFSGTLTNDHSPNVTFTGRIGDFSDSPTSSSLRDGTTLNQYNSVYTIFLKDNQGEWVRDTRFVVDAPNIIYNGALLKNAKWTNGNLSAFTMDGNPVNLVLYFHHNAPSSDAGSQFYGRLWYAGGSPPMSGNCLGLVRQSEDPVGRASLALQRSISRTAAINVAAGVSSLALCRCILQYFSARSKANASSSEQDKKAVDEANKKIDDASEVEERVAEEVVEISPDIETAGFDLEAGPQVSGFRIYFVHIPMLYDAANRSRGGGGG